MLELKDICFERENRKILDNINLKIDTKTVKLKMRMNNN